MRSVRRQLLATLLGAVAVAALAGALGTYRVARAQIDALLDDQLRNVALALRDQAGSGAPAGGVTVPAELQLVVQLLDDDGRLLWASARAGPPPIPAPGFATVRAPAGAWRVYATPVVFGALQVAQPLSVREALAVASALRTLAPLAVVLPLLALLVWWVVGRGLAPLDRLAGAAAARTPSALEPFSEGGTPEEVLPLVRSLNALLGRLGAALAAQRAFVADAAHALRTPLAALRLQAQLAERAPEGVERVAALAELRAGLDRATRVVEQLLTLAREEPGVAGAGRVERVALAELVAQAVADHALLAEAKTIDLGGAPVDAGAAARADPAALAAALGDLVDNAIRYTPAGGRVDVAAGASGGEAWLEVTDSGPGIPAADRARALDRFWRGRSGGEPGSGLGLAIVRAVAERHGGRVALSEAPGGGLRARITVPAAGGAQEGRAALSSP